MENLKFKKFDGTPIDDIHLYVKQWVNENPYGTITVGCDSQEYPKYIQYAITVCMHYIDELGIGHGGHVVYSSITDKNRNMKTDVYTKLWAECELTVKAAELIGDIGHKINVHLDYNSVPTEYSNMLYSSGIGYVNAMGFEAFGKPYSYSCHTADMIAKHKMKK